MGVGKSGSAEAGRGAAKQGRHPGRSLHAGIHTVSAKKRAGRGRHIVMKNQVGKLVVKGYQAGQGRQQLKAGRRREAGKVMQAVSDC